MVADGFSQGPVMQVFDGFFVVSLYKLLNTNTTILNMDFYDLS